MGITAEFESPTYRIEIFDGDTLVASEPELPSGHLAVAPIYPAGWDPECQCVVVIVHAFKENDEGECEWNQSYAAAVPIVVVDPETGEVVARVNGDRIRTVENLNRGHSEDRMVYTDQRIQAADITSLTI